MIEGKNHILLTTHSFPDADGVGSMIALYYALIKLNKKVYCYIDESLSERFLKIDEEKIIKPLIDLPDNLKPQLGSKKSKKKKFDLAIILDTHTFLRTGKNMIHHLTSWDVPMLYVDHHPTKLEALGEHCIDTSASATAEIIGHIIEAYKIPFTKRMALALYTAIVIDTSSFRYPSVSSKTHLLVSKLLSSGITAHESYGIIYSGRTINHLQFLGHVLASAQINERNDFAYLIVTGKKLKESNINIEETHSYINNLLIIDGIKVAAMFRVEDEFIKISFRSIGHYDVGELASYLGGGGHSHSAATSISVAKKNINELLEDLIRTIDFFIKNMSL